MRFWISARDGSALDDWVGVVDEKDKLGWQAELVRHSASPFDARSAGLFEENRRFVSALYDLRTPMTLVEPFLIRPSTMQFDTDQTDYRSKIGIQFFSYLKGVSAHDCENQLVLSISAVSPTLGAWHCPQTVSQDYSIFPPKEIRIHEPKQFSFHLGENSTLNLEEMVTSSARVSQETIQIESSVRLTITFAKPVKINVATDIIFKLENLFCFLIGRRMGIPTYELQFDFASATARNVRRADYVSRNVLEPNTNVPDHFQRFTTRFDDIVDIGKAVSAVLIGNKTLESVLLGIVATGANMDLAERFRLIVSASEGYLAEKFQDEENVKFQESEAAFWTFIDECEVSEIQGFCRKHIAIKNSKRVSLASSVNRAVDLVNQYGAELDHFGSKVRDVRAKVMHRLPIFDDTSAQVTHDVTEKLRFVLSVNALHDMGAPPFALKSWLLRSVHVWRRWVS